MSVMTISVSTTSGEKFDKIIRVAGKNCDVLIQTDKAIYKQGDKVLFRVLVIDADFKPCEYKTMKIEVTDGKKQKIITRPEKFSENGFIEDSIELSDELNFGMWTLIVFLESEQQSEYSFEVVNYQLPEFEVFIDAPKHVSIDQKSIKVEVLGRYTIGSGQQLVKGSATKLVASIYDPSRPDTMLKNTTEIFRRNNQVLLELDRDLMIPGHLNKVLLKLEGFFEDSITHQTSSGQTTVEIYRFKDETVEIIPENEFITPGKPYKIKVVVKNFDGSLLKEKNNIEFKVHHQKLKNKCSPDIKTNMQWEKLQQFSRSSKTINGTAEFTVDVPEESLNIVIGVLYKNKYYVHKAFRLQTKSRENFGLTVDTKK